MPRKWEEGDAFYGEYQTVLFALGSDDARDQLRDHEQVFLADAESVDIQDAR